MHKHLAIFSPQVIKQIFSGRKLAESRFSQKKIAPYGMISVGDLVYIKPSGEEITGQFVVSKVVSFDGLEESDWDLIKKTYTKKLALGNEEEQAQYFKTHSNAKYATIIFMDRVEQFITSPVKITKRDLRGWAVLDQ